MKSISILIFSLIILGNMQSVNFMESKLEKPLAAHKANNQFSEKLWQLESITESKPNKNLEWNPTRLTLFYYDENGSLDNTIIYNDFSVESKKYSSRTEHRNISKPNFEGDIIPFNDSNLTNWDGSKGAIFLTNKTMNEVEEYQFRYAANHDKWILFKLMRDSMEDNRKLKRYFYSDIDPGNYPVQESKIIYKYTDTLLVEVLNMYKDHLNANDWKYSKKESFSYQDQRLATKEVYFFSEETDQWRLSKEKKIEYGANQLSETFFEYNHESKSKTGYEIVEEQDENGNLMIKKHSKWDNKNKQFEHFSTENYVYVNNAVSEIITSHFTSGYYDKYVTSNLYDSEGRIKQSEKKVKNDEDKNWKVLSQLSYDYLNQEKTPFQVIKTNSKGIEIEKTSIEFDKSQNPTKRIFEKNGLKRAIEISHDYSINANDVLLPNNLKVLKTDIGDYTWKHNKAPSKRTYFRFNKGHKKEYSRVIYKYKKRR